MSDFNDGIEKARAYIIHDPEMGDYLSWSEQAALNSEHGFTRLFTRPTPDRSEARERIAHLLEGIILMRLHNKRIAGYTLEMSLEQADAILATGLVQDERPLGEVFNELVRRMNFDGMDPRTFTLGELERAIEGAEFPK